MKLSTLVSDASPCAICGEVTEWRFSTRRPVRFAGEVRNFKRCASCGSRSLTPMPSGLELSSLYGAEYNGDAIDGPGIEGDPRAYDWLMAHLNRVQPKRFVDYGCGSGALLRMVAASNIEAIGFDVSVSGVEAASLSSGCVVRTLADIDTYTGSADVVHLGDVLEHVPDPVEVLAQACTLLRPGGLLLAEGPMEANLSLFNGVLAMAAFIQGRKPVDAPPHHVHLPTARGQLKLFERAMLITKEFETSDISWPAPDRWTREIAASPRLSALYVLRRFSTLVWEIAPDRLSRRMANRFRYSGTMTSSSETN